MKRRLKAIGIIFGVTVLIAVLYLGISKLIEIHVASEMVGGSSPNTNGTESAFPVIWPVAHAWQRVACIGISVPCPFVSV